MKKQTENEIKEKYEISSSTIKRIIQSQKAEIIKYRTDTISTYLEWLSSSNVMEFIEAFIKRNKRAFTSFDLWRQVSEELSITIKPNVVNRVLKKWFALRYKKGLIVLLILMWRNKNDWRLSFDFICWNFWLLSSYWLT